ncbi:DUF4838 domain-containing protein [candidate division NPL-UPA2 bacterium]|nr:DUF4838 domain-containing protein [candidate division NPL-UPA2 bacterium]
MMRQKGGTNVTRMFKRIVMLVGVLLVAGILAGCLPSPEEENGIRLLDGQEGHLLSRIVVPSGAHPVEEAAARELQHYLLKMTGWEIPLVTSAEKIPAGPGIIFVGSTRAARQEGLLEEKLLDALEAGQLGYDAFAVQSKGGRVVIAGINHRATVYGVYRLLEKLGWRVYADEPRDREEVIPKIGEIPGPFTIADGAAFEWRAMAVATLPMMKARFSPSEQGASVAGVEIPEMMATVYDERVGRRRWHHTLGFLLPGELLAKTNPEYLAVVDGERKVFADPRHQQYCLSNPELLSLMTEAILQWIEENPGRLYYPVHHGDVVRYCECDDCQALIEEKGSLTDAVLWWQNQVAQAVAREWPDKFITMLLYHGTMPPPVNIKPEPNLLLIFCPMNECQARPWSAPVNLKLEVLAHLEGWIDIHPLGGKGIITFEYPTAHGLCGLPFPALYAFVENVRHYRELGIRGVYICGISRWSHLAHLYSYIISRILWNPDYDLTKLVEDFSRGWYGAAWEPMRDYINLLHRRAITSDYPGLMYTHHPPHTGFFRELWRPEFAAEAYTLFAKAERLAEDPAVEHRILRDKWGLLLVDLALNTPRPQYLVPVPGEVRPLMKEDFEKKAELLRIHQLFGRGWRICWLRGDTLSLVVGITPTEQPWYTCPQILELMNNPADVYRRQSDIFPDAAELARQHFITLENEHVKMVVIPQLGGRIWQLYDKSLQQNIFWSGNIPLRALQDGLSPQVWVNLGGYEEYTGKRFASPGWAEAYEFQISPEGNEIILTASLPGEEVKIRRTLTLLADVPGVEIDSVLTNTSTETREDAMLRAHPQFAFQPGERDLEFKTVDGRFKTLPLRRGETFFTDEDLPAGAWRVRFPESGVVLVNEFEPAQVGTCFLMVGTEFFNLELFSVQKDLAPGETIRLTHRYLILPEGQ